MKKLLVTGATGFIGRALTTYLLSLKLDITVSVRKVSTDLPDCVNQFQVNKNLSKTDWSDALQDIEVVIHTIARAHVMHDNALNPLTEYRKVNVEGTLNLAEQAASAGISRFVFLSSIKVNGEQTTQNHPFTPDDKFIPIDPYGLSKYEAEQSLLALSRQTKMEIVIIRPPLVYGHKVKGNFSSLLKWTQKEIPLPFGSIHNLRSLVGIDNLVDFIFQCCKHPNASNEIFLISDDEDISTPHLLKKVSHAFDKKILLLPIPICILSFIAKILNRKALINRLTCSLQVDISKTKKLLSWEPISTMDEQLNKIATLMINEKNF